MGVPIGTARLDGSCVWRSVRLCRATTPRLDGSTARRGVGKRAVVPPHSTAELSLRLQLEWNCYQRERDTTQGQPVERSRFGDTHAEGNSASDVEQPAGSFRANVRLHVCGGRVAPGENTFEFMSSQPPEARHFGSVLAADEAGPPEVELDAKGTRIVRAGVPARRRGRRASWERPGARFLCRQAGGGGSDDQECGCELDEGSHMSGVKGGEGAGSNIARARQFGDIETARGEPDWRSGALKALSRAKLPSSCELNETSLEAIFNSLQLDTPYPP